jgi:hypothetical protein
MIEIESKNNKNNLQDEMENVQILQDLQKGIVDLTVKSQKRSSRISVQNFCLFPYAGQFSFVSFSLVSRIIMIFS